MPGIRYRGKRQLDDDARWLHLAGHGSGAGNLISAEDLEDDALSGLSFPQRSVLPINLTAYIFRDVQVTGTQDSHQIIEFSALGTPDEGGTMPAFISAPRVAITAFKTGRAVFIEKDSITTSQFEIWASPAGEGDTVYCDLEITDLGLAV